jgi:hypothetical protein
MYSTRPGLILGFHGCDKSILENVLNGKSELNFSENTFDWLGHRIYFREYSASRALDYAIEASRHKRGNSKIAEPAILGAVIDLGFCLDLIEFDNLQLLNRNFELFQDTCRSYGLKLPTNKHGWSVTDLHLRDLDSAIIEFVHQSRIDLNLKSYDSVKGVFQEGLVLYPNAGFKEKNHVQICIRNPYCIKGFFLPRMLDEKYPLV